MQRKPKVSVTQWKAVWLWVKDKILPTIITTCLIAITVTCWRIYMIIKDYPDNKTANAKQHELMWKEINQIKWRLIDYRGLILKNEVNIDSLKQGL